MSANPYSPSKEWKDARVDKPNGKRVFVWLLGSLGFLAVLGFGALLVYGTVTHPEPGPVEGIAFLFGVFSCLFLAPIAGALGVGLGLLLPWALEKERERYGRD